MRFYHPILIALALFYLVYNSYALFREEIPIRSVSEVTERAAEIRGSYSAPELIDLGYLDVTLPPYSADNTGKEDVTRILQQAMFDARDSQVVCYLPAGDYLVSDTLEGIVGVVQWDEWHYGDANPFEAEASFEYPTLLMGDTRGVGRARLILADHADGFDDEDNPKPVLYFWARAMQSLPPKEDPNNSQSNINFNQKIISLDIVLGDNPGAAGVRHRGAEGSTVEDVSVDATHAFAGFYNAPGSGGSMHGLKVKGGKYGVFLDGTQPSPLLNDIELIDQREASIYGHHRGPLTLVGALIRGKGILGTTDSIFFEGMYNIIDSVIELDEPHTALVSHRAAVIRNTYIFNAKTVLKLKGEPGIEGAPGKWLHIENFASGTEFEYTEDAGGHEWQDTVWREKEEIGLIHEVNIVDRPGIGDLFESHKIPAYLSCKSPGVAIVTTSPYYAKGDGKADDYPAIQKAIDTSDLVFLPPGTYKISEPLRLRPDTQLFGISQLHSIITADNEASAYSDPNDPQPLIISADGKNYAPRLEMLRLRIPVKNPCVYAVKWQSGENSIVRNVYADRDFFHPFAAAMSIPMYLVTGNGGGRWYNHLFLGGWAQGPNFRNMLIKGTRNPLRFYHLQPQFARGNAMIEIQDSENIEIYSMKSEGDITLIKISDSRNIATYGLSGLILPMPGMALLDIQNSENILFANMSPMVFIIGHYVGHLVQYDPTRWHMLRDDDLKIPGNEQFTWYQN